MSEESNPYRVLRDPVIRRVLVVCLLLGNAYGLTLSVLSLFLHGRGHGAGSIGWLATAFAAGIALFSFPVSLLATRFGARTVLAIALLGYASVTAVLPFLGTFALIAGSRVLDGAFSAGVWTSTESTLLSRASRDHKALVTTAYAVALSIGYVFGPLLATAITYVLPTSFVFYAAALLAALGACLAASLPDHSHAPDADPAPSATERRSSFAILVRIKAACAAVFAYGYFQSALILFLPLYLTDEQLLAQDRAIALPASFAAGMLMFSNIVGRIGDRFGHQQTLCALTTLGAATVGGFHFLESFPLMVAAVFVAGATLGVVWPLALALQGVLVHPHEYARSNGIANVFYAAGMILGPPLAARVYDRFGGPWLFGHLSALWIGVTVMAIATGRGDPRNRPHGRTATIPPMSKSSGTPCSSL